KEDGGCQSDEPGPHRRLLEEQQRSRRQDNRKGGRQQDHRGRLPSPRRRVSLGFSPKARRYWRLKCPCCWKPQERLISVIESAEWASRRRAFCRRRSR